MGCIACISGAGQWLDGRHRRIEHVPAPRKRLDDLLVLVAQGSPQVLDALDERVVGHDHGAPERLDQLILAEDATFVRQKVAQECKGLGRQRNDGVGLAKLLPRGLEHEARERHRALAIGQSLGHPIRCWISHPSTPIAMNASAIRARPLGCILSLFLASRALARPRCRPLADLSTMAARLFAERGPRCLRAADRAAARP